MTNAVLLMFWAGDALQREAEHLRHLLAVAVHQRTPAHSSSLPQPLQSILTRVPGACLYWDGLHYAGTRADVLCGQGLQALVGKTAQTETAYNSSADFSIIDPVSFRYLRVSVPVRLADNAPAVVSVGIPVSSVLHSLWEKERIIAVYLLFNTIVLVSLAFLRFLKRYILPLDRMVRAAETYRGDGFQVFVDRPVDELGHLAASIHSMVQRIETDKEALNETVKELGKKNSLLQSNQKEMVRAEKLASVGRLAAGLAHEIGNPIGVVQGYLQLLGMKECQEQERIDYVAKALEEMGRVDRLIRRLLDHARTSPGKATDFDMHDLIVEVTESLKVQPLFSGIHVNLRLEAEKGIVCLEYEKLRQVIVNCLLNAADAVKMKWGRDGGEICVRTSDKKEVLSYRQGAFFVTSIADNGCGIPPGLLEAVFDPFFTTKDPGSGTGLGLSVSQALIESMGGCIRLSSVEGTGTTVQLVIPIAVEER